MTEIFAHGDEAALEELRLVDGKDSVLDIEVIQVQSQGFANAQSCAIKQQQQRSDCVRIKNPNEPMA